MITLAQAAKDLIAVPRPILFVDTCTLLDIVRAPLRDLSLEVQAGLELRTLAAVGTVQLFVQDIVFREWNDNLSTARRDGEGGIRAFAATWQIAADLAHPAPPLPVLAPTTLIDDLEQLSRDILTAAEELDRDHAATSWAIDRVAAKQKPSSTKGPVKDCYILGHALRLSTLLEVAGYRNWRVLISSNRSDFAASSATVFHPQIVPDATAAGLRYAVTLQSAIADLRAAGEIP